MRYLMLVAVAALTLAACSDGDGNSAPAPTPPPASTEADQLFQRGLSALDETESLRFETTIYDAEGNVTVTRIDEQARPDRARRLITDVAAGTVVDARIAGAKIVQIQADGERLEAEAPPGESFSYPGTWQAEFGSLTGFTILREETFEGRPAIVIAHTGPTEGAANSIDEQLVWIDKESGRILRWDSSQYEVDGEERTLTARAESSLWEYDQEVTVEFP